jgi:hypothetical protein
MKKSICRPMDKSLRFDWFDTLRIDLLDDLSSKVALVIDLDKNTKNQSPEQLKNQKNKDLVVVYQLLSALYQAYFTLPIGEHEVSISTSPSAYTRDTNGILPMKFPYRSVMRALRAIEKLSWIDRKTGNTFKGYTRIRATHELAVFFQSSGFTWVSTPLVDTGDLVRLRDRESTKSKKKMELPVPKTPEVIAYQALLHSYNEYLVKHCVALNLTDSQLREVANAMSKTTLNFHQVQLRRIFSRGSFSKGGRLYGGWWQGVPSLFRPHITIDGYRTTEVDYSSIALRIIYAKEGLEIPDCDDLYDLGLSDWGGSQDPRRSIIKKYVNALLNDESGHFKLKRSDLVELGLSQKTLKRLVEQKHPAITHLFNSGVGLDAQFVDSQIALAVMHKMMAQDILVLPIHDSFIVRVGQRATLHDVMYEAFEEITGQRTSTSETGPSTKELFGINIEKMDIESRCRVITLEEAFDSEIKMPSRLMHNFVASWRRYQHAENTHKSSHTGA